MGTGAEYGKMTQKELLELCRRRGIKANSKMSKAKLTGLLVDDGKAQTEGECETSLGRYRVSTKGGGPLNVRQADSKAAPVVREIPNGTEFQATPYGDWLRLDDGFVIASLAVKN